MPLRACFRTAGTAGAVTPLDTLAVLLETCEPTSIHGDARLNYLGIGNDADSTDPREKAS